MAFSPAAPLLIVATLPYLSQIVQEVTCSSPAIQVETLVPVGTDPHDFVPTARHNKSLAQAHLVLAVHPQLESWLRISPKVPTLYTSLGLALDPLVGGCGHWHHSGNGHSAHLDTHVWHSPELTMEISKKVASILMDKEMSLIKPIKGCLDLWTTSINREKTKLSKELSNIPSSQRVAVTHHNSFGYLGKAFSFKFIPALGATTHGQPTAQDIKSLRDAIKTHDVRVAFPDVGQSKKALVKLVGRDVSLGPALYSDNLTPPQGPAPTILALWRTNVRALAQGIRNAYAPNFPEKGAYSLKKVNKK